MFASLAEGQFVNVAPLADLWRTFSVSLALESHCQVKDTIVDHSLRIKSEDEMKSFHDKSIIADRYHTAKWVSLAERA